MISIIIPTKNEADCLKRTLRQARCGLVHEIIVTDNNSTDNTRSIAESLGCRVLKVSGSRGSRLNRAAAMAGGDILLFLHADTLLPAGFAEDICSMLEDTRVIAGAFRLSISAPDRGLNFVCTMANLRSRLLQLPYGDQALFIKRKIFLQEKGFPDMPIMEDYVFVKQLKKKGRIGLCSSSVVTSARRWKKLGIAKTTLVNQLMLIGYHLGISPERLASFYRGRS